MPAKEEIIELIYSVIDTINESEDVKLEKSPETPIYGDKGNLDSFGFVNLVTSVEEAIDEEFNATISIADERAMSQKKSPFRTISTLADYIQILINED